MADHEDDVVVAAASFLYFFNDENANEEDRVPVKRPRRFWIHEYMTRCIVDRN